MKKGFLTASKTKSSSDKGKEKQKQPLAPSQTPQPSAPSTFTTSPSLSTHPLRLHWYFPSSTSSPTSTQAWFITSSSSSLLSPSPLPTASLPSPPLWEVKPIPGKGLGVIALRPIPPKTALWSEPPLFVIPSDPSLAPPESEARHAISKLDPTAQATLLDLYNAFPSSNGFVQGIFRSNAFPCVQIGEEGDEGQGMGYQGVFELVSRVNHSCWANSRVEWDTKERRVRVTTLREVKEGEEVTLSWIVTIQKRKERMQELRLKYKFECACEWCSLSEEESAKRDEEREEKAKLFLKMMSAEGQI